MKKGHVTPQKPPAREKMPTFPVGPDSHDQKWSGMGPANAVFIGSALVQADRLREQHADPGDAYLAGIADLNDALRRTADGQALVDKWNVDEVISDILATG